MREAVFLDENRQYEELEEEEVEVEAASLARSAAVAPLYVRWQCCCNKLNFLFIPRYFIGKKILIISIIRIYFSTTARQCAERDEVAEERERERERERRGRGAMGDANGVWTTILIVFFGTAAGIFRLLPGVLLHLVRAAIGLEKRTFAFSLPETAAEKFRFTSESLIGADSGYVDKYIESRREGTSTKVRIHVVEDDGKRRIETDEGQQLPPIVLVHGFPGLWLEWKDQMRFFYEAGHRVTAVSLRGYGESDRPEGVENYKMGRLVEDIAAAIEHASTFPDGRRRKPLLVGHDWGAAICWAYINRRESHDSICGYVALAVPPSKLFFEGLKKSIVQMYASLYMLFFMVPLLPELAFGVGDAWLVGLGLGSSVKDPDSKLIEACRRNMMFSSSHGRRQYRMTPALNYYRAMLDTGNKRASTAEGHLDDVKAPFPILMIRGEQDVALTASVFEGYQSELGPNAQLLSIKACSHWIQHDASDVVNAAISSCLNRVTSVL